MYVYMYIVHSDTHVVQVYTHLCDMKTCTYMYIHVHGSQGRAPRHPTHFVIVYIPVCDVYIRSRFPSSLPYNS